MDKVTEGMHKQLNAQPEVQDYAEGMEFKPPCIVRCVPDEVYFKDVPGWNSTKTRKVLNRKGELTPGKFYALRINKAFSVKYDEAEDKTAYIIGRKIHERTLFGFWEPSTDPDVFVGKTKQTLTGTKNTQIVEMCAASMLARPRFQTMLSGAYKELVAVVQCPITGLILKAKFDIVDCDLQNIADIKSTADLEKLVNPAEWINTFRKYGYQYQEAHYLYCANLAFGEPLFGAERKMTFIAVEKGNDYDVEFIETEYEKRVEAHEQYMVALKRIAAGLKTGNWFDGSINSKGERIT